MRQQDRLGKKAQDELLSILSYKWTTSQVTFLLLAWRECSKPGLGGQEGRRDWDPGAISSGWEQPSLCKAIGIAQWGRGLWRLKSDLWGWGDR